MQHVVYSFIVLDFNSNEEVFRFEDDTRQKVESKLESLKVENGTQYKVLISGSVGFVSETVDVPNDIVAKVEILNLKLPKN